MICPAGETLSVIAIAYSKEYIIWYDRDGPHGGGIAARAKKVIVGRLSRYAWDTPNITIEDKIIKGKIPVTYEILQYVDENGLGEYGTQIPGDPKSMPAATSHYNYIFMLPDHMNQMVAISLSRTAGRKAKEFNTLLTMGDTPSFLRIYQLGSFIEHKEQNSWANVQFTGFQTVLDEKFGHELAVLHESMKDRGIAVEDDHDETATSKKQSERY